MDSDDKFWMYMWSIIGILVFLITVSISSCTMYTNFKIGEAIKNGADPIEASVAFSIDSHEDKVIGLLKD